MRAHTYATVVLEISSRWGMKRFWLPPPPCAGSRLHQARDWLRTLRHSSNRSGCFSRHGCGRL